MAVLGAVGQAFGTLGEMDRAPIRINALVLEHLTATSSVLAACIQQHFTSQVIGQVGPHSHPWLTRARDDVSDLVFLPTIPRTLFIKKALFANEIDNSP
jgi:hypothetical protein